MKNIYSVCCLFLSTGFTLLFSSVVSAQNFYVDIGFVIDSTPSSNFSAAADQPGVWNVLNTAPATLTDTAGNLTAVSFESSPQTTFTGFFHNPGTSGDDSILMDDSGNTSSEPGAFNTLTINGLQAGNYLVYTYAWQPGFPTFLTASINVNDTGAQLVAPELAEFAGYELGENYSLHKVVIGEDESLNIVITAVPDGFTYASFNGFQLIRLDESMFEDGFESSGAP